MPSSPYADLVLGLDLGTSSCKACLTDLQGCVQRRAQSRYPTHTPHPTWAEQDPADWLAAVVDAIRQLAISPRRLGMIALTSAAHIGVLLDDADRVVRRAILWNDQRSAPQARALHERHGAMILDQTRNAVSSGWTLAQLAWVAENEPQNWARVRRILLSKDYLAWWLTGERVTDAATAVSSQLYDAAKAAWSDSLCGIIKLPVDALPAVRDVCTVVGELQPALAKTLGLQEGIPVVNGTLDSATELLAAGCRRAGEGMIRLATAGGLQVVVERPSPHPQRITYPHPDRPAWYAQAGTNTCAAAVQWVSRLLADSFSYDELERQAAQAPPGCDGLLFHPYLAGERAPYWNPDLRASFSGLALNHGRAHLIRATLEGTAFSIRDAMRTLADVPLADGPTPVVGGGSRNKLWVQTLANVLDRPLCPLRDCDSALGAAQLARQVLCGNARPLRGPLEATVLPQSELVERFARLFQRYQDTAPDA